MVKVENIKLKFLVKQKTGRVFLSIRGASNKVRYVFVLKSAEMPALWAPNKAHLFFKRFQFIMNITDRLVKNGLIN